MNNNAHTELKFKKKSQKKSIELDYSLISNIQFYGIDHSDYPDYCDAYIVGAEYNGEQMTDEQIEILNDDKEFVLEELINYLY